MAGEVMTAANHVQNLIGIDAELTSSQVEKIWRILFVHPLYTVKSPYSSSPYSHYLFIVTSFP